MHRRRQWDPREKNERSLRRLPLDDLGSLRTLSRPSTTPVVRRSKALAYPAPMISRTLLCPSIAATAALVSFALAGDPIAQNRDGSGLAPKSATGTEAIVSSFVAAG